MTGRNSRPTSQPDPEHGFDSAVERLGRWTAAHSTRRSFLHRLGQLAVVVAAGPTIAGLIMRRAEARVCGQSGVSPKCDTFDCVGAGTAWGWCWYASDGCCANGGLKKICDCCTVNWPNVHGYCPAGSNVRCIVESCGTDPRVQTVALAAVAWDAAAGYSHAAIRAAQSIATRAVVAPADNRWLQIVAAPLAGALGVPLLAVPGTGPSAADLDLLRSLGVSEVVAVGPVAGAGAFAGAGMPLSSITTSTDPATASQAVATKIAAVNDINRTVTVETSGLSAEAAPLAAVFAALGGFPLLVGSATAAAVGLPTVAVGPEVPAGWPVDQRTSAGSLPELSVEIADWTLALPTVAPGRVAIAPAGSSDVIGLVNLAAPLVLHPAGRLGPVADWLNRYARRYGQLRHLYHTTGPGQLATDQHWWLQGTVNGFQVDQLQGVSGQGLPVISQPMAERPIGLARVGAGGPAYGADGPPAYWTGQGQTFRR